MIKKIFLCLVFSPFTFGSEDQTEYQNSFLGGPFYSEGTIPVLAEVKQLLSQSKGQCCINQETPERPPKITKRLGVQELRGKSLSVNQKTEHRLPGHFTLTSQSIGPGMGRGNISLVKEAVPPKLAILKEEKPGKLGQSEPNQVIKKSNHFKERPKTSIRPPKILKQISVLFFKPETPDESKKPGESKKSNEPRKRVKSKNDEPKKPENSVKKPKNLQMIDESLDIRLFMIENPQLKNILKDGIIWDEKGKKCVHDFFDIFLEISDQIMLGNLEAAFHVGFLRFNAYLRSPAGYFGSKDFPSDLEYDYLEGGSKFCHYLWSFAACVNFMRKLEMKNVHFDYLPNFYLNLLIDIEWGKIVKGNQANGNAHQVIDEKLFFMQIGTKFINNLKAFGKTYPIAKEVIKEYIKFWALYAKINHNVGSQFEASSKSSQILLDCYQYLNEELEKVRL
jgi:hypothetical protein